KGIGSMIDVEHGTLRTFKQNGFAIGQRLVQQDCGVAYEGGYLLGGLSVLGVHLVGVQGFRVKERMRDHVFLANRIFDVLLQQFEVEQIGDAQAAPAHLVFVCGSDSARSGANLDASGSIFRGQFNHAVIRENHMRAVRDEEIAVDLHTSLAQGADFFEESERVEHHAVSNHTAASGAQNSTGHQLENELLAIDDDGVAGVVSAGVAGNDGKAFRE